MYEHSHVPWLPTGTAASLTIVLAGSLITLVTQTWSVPVVSGLLVGLVIGWGSAVCWVVERVPRQRPHWECWKCRYDRRGCLPGSRCPECGVRCGEG